MTQLKKTAFWFYYSVFLVQNDLGSGSRSHEFAIYAIRMSVFMFLFALGWLLVKPALPEVLEREAAQKLALGILAVAAIVSLCGVRLVFGKHSSLIKQCGHWEEEGFEVPIAKKLLVTIMIVAAMFSPALALFLPYE